MCYYTGLGPLTGEFKTGKRVYYFALLVGQARLL